MKSIFGWVKNVVIIVIILAVLGVLLYPKENGYKSTGLFGAYKLSKCDCVGYNYEYGFLGQTKFYCIGIPLTFKCTTEEKRPFGL